jgi:2-oxoglutarate ferredoxin oxidoreductase subunit beta
MSTPINPVEPFLRADRMPHIWCPGCGIGTTVNCLARALVESKLPLEKVAVVSGIGCTGRVAGYLHLDSFHTTHGRAIPFATGLKLANPSLHVWSIVATATSLRSAATILFMPRVATLILPLSA